MGELSDAQLDSVAAGKQGVLPPEWGGKSRPRAAVAAQVRAGAAGAVAAPQGAAGVTCPGGACKRA